MLEKALFLKQLYLRKMCGETYCKMPNLNKQINIVEPKKLNTTIESCTLCELCKQANNKIEGYLFGFDIAFITLKPVLEQTASFEMIENIAKKVFGVEKYSLLSLIKCNLDRENLINNHHIDACSGYLKTQLEKINPKLIVFFGSEILQNGDLGLYRGRILSENILGKKRDFIVTFRIIDLIKSRENKASALKDFLSAKEFLNSLK